MRAQLNWGVDRDKKPSFIYYVWYGEVRGLDVPVLVSTNYCWGVVAYPLHSPQLRSVSHDVITGHHFLFYGLGDVETSRSIWTLSQQCLMR